MLSNTELIFPLEIAKFTFFAVYVLATIGVIVGVYWEGDQFTKEKQQRGWRLLVCSLAVDTLLTVLIFGTDGWISSIQRNEILALESHLSARGLTDNQSAFVVSRLAKVIPFDIRQISFEIAGSNDEEFALAIDLADHVFSKLGWDWIDWPSDIGAFGTELPTRGKRLGWVPLSGIQIQVSDQRLSKVADTLIAALQSVGLENVRSDPKLNAEFSKMNSKPTVAVMIGIRPPLRLPRP